MEGFSVGHRVQVLDQEDGLYWDAVVKELNGEGQARVWIPLCKLSMLYSTDFLRGCLEERILQRDSRFKRSELRLLVRKREIAYKDGDKTIISEVVVNDPFQAFFKLSNGEEVAYEQIIDIKPQTEDDDIDVHMRNESKEENLDEPRPSSKKSTKETPKGVKQTQKSSKEAETNSKETPKSSKAMITSPKVTPKYPMVMSKGSKEAHRFPKEALKSSKEQQNVKQRSNHKQEVRKFKKVVKIRPSRKKVVPRRTIQKVRKSKLLVRKFKTKSTKEPMKTLSGKDKSSGPESIANGDDELVRTLPVPLDQSQAPTFSGQALQLLPQSNSQVLNSSLPLSADFISTQAPSVPFLPAGGMASSGSGMFPGLPAGSLYQCSPSKDLHNLSPSYAFPGAMHGSGSMNYMSLPFPDVLSSQPTSLNNNTLADLQIGRLSDLMEKSFFEQKEQTLILRRLMEGQEAMLGHLAKILQEINTPVHVNELAYSQAPPVSNPACVPQMVNSDHLGNGLPVSFVEAAVSGTLSTACEAAASYTGSQAGMDLTTQRHP